MHYYYLHGAIDQASGPHHHRLLAAWTETSGWQAEKQRAEESHRLWLGVKRKAPVGMEEALLLGLCAPAAKRRIRRSVRRFAVVPGGRSSRLGGGPYSLKEPSERYPRCPPREKRNQSIGGGGSPNLELGRWKGHA